MNGISRRQLLGALPAAFLAGRAQALSGKTAMHDVLVIGAGLSGLHAAMLLEEQGLDVQVIEGRDRVGGRVYTLMEVPGRPEAAGELIGSNYARMLSTARGLGLDLIEPNPLGPKGDWLYHIGGEMIKAGEWTGHARNPLSGDDREILPHRLLATLSHRNNPLSGAPLDAWVGAEFRRFDIPHAHYLRTELGLSDEVIRLMNVVIHTDHIDNTSALHELRRYAVGERNRSAALGKSGRSASLQVRGGNSLLPLAMAESLTREVQLRKTVYALDDRGDAVTVYCDDGTRYRARRVICSIPYPVLRNVRFSPRLPAHRAAAIDEIDYGISIQLHFLVSRPFWELDGLPESIWSDGPIERFAVLHRGADGEVTSAVAFINGNEAYKYSFMSDQEAFHYTLAELARVRPATRGALEPVLVQSCHRDVHGGGDWVFWRPGQVGQYAGGMREPHGNIHFCGEHTALLERGMEGAFESGERAALDILLG